MYFTKSDKKIIRFTACISAAAGLLLLFVTLQFYTMGWNVYELTETTEYMMYSSFMVSGIPLALLCSDKKHAVFKTALAVTAAVFIINNILKTIVYTGYRFTFIDYLRMDLEYDYGIRYFVLFAVLFTVPAAVLKITRRKYLKSIFTGTSSKDTSQIFPLYAGKNFIIRPAVISDMPDIMNLSEKDPDISMFFLEHAISKSSAYGSVYVVTCRKKVIAYAVVTRLLTFNYRLYTFFPYIFTGSIVTALLTCPLFCDKCKHSLSVTVSGRIPVLLADRAVKKLKVSGTATEENKRKVVIYTKECNSTFNNT